VPWPPLNDWIILVLRTKANDGHTSTNEKPQGRATVTSLISSAVSLIKMAELGSEALILAWTPSNDGRNLPAQGAPTPPQLHPPHTMTGSGSCVP